MRNLAEHPITKREMVETLRRIAKELEDTHSDHAGYPFIAYMDAVVLEKAAEVIDAQPTQRSSNQ